MFSRRKTRIAIRQLDEVGYREYSGNLNNGGERIVLQDAFNENILSLTPESHRQGRI